MATGPDIAGELKATIKVARKRELNFALCLGKKVEGAVLITDKIKAPNALAKRAKKEGETPKVAFGRMKVDGRELQLTCEKEPPPGLAKKARLYLKSAAGLSMAIKVMDAAGEVLEQEVLDEGGVEVYADAEDLPPEPEEERSRERAEDQTTGDGTLGENDDLKSRLVALQERIAGIEGDAAQKLLQALKVAAQLNAAGRTAKSAAAMDQIEAALARVVSGTQPEEQKNDPTDAKALLARLNDLSGRIKALDDPRTDKLKEAMAKVAAAFKAGKYLAAAAGADQIESALGKLGSSSPQQTEAPPTKPDPKVAKALEIVGVMQKRAEALSDSTARADFFENLTDARARADAGDGEGALVTLRALQTALKALETAPQYETTPEAAPSVADRVEERASKPKSPLEYWNSGKATADEAISALQKSLKEIGDPDLDKIAEFGLHGLMDGHQVKLLTALIDYSKSGADSRAKTAQKVIAQCKSYRSVLNANTVIKLCEANPFGIKADIRGPLNHALTQIEAACAA